MLVLSRKVNEKIKIGEDIEITIVSVSGDNIRIGIDAPKSITILRSEVYDEIQKENREAVIKDANKVSDILQNLISQNEILSKSKD